MEAERAELAGKDKGGKKNGKKMRRIVSTEERGSYRIFGVKPD
jgi:hypothetical protein